MRYYTSLQQEVKQPDDIALQATSNNEKIKSKVVSNAVTYDLDAYIIVNINNSQRVNNSEKIANTIKTHSKLNCNIIFLNAKIFKNQAQFSHIVNSEKTTKYHGRKLKIGQVGCAVSHLTVYSQIVNKAKNLALVIQDDASIGTDVLSFIDDIIKQSIQVDIVNFHTDRRNINDRQRIKVGKNFIYKNNMPTNRTTCYLISRSACKKILSKSQKVIHAADGMTGDYEKGGCVSYVTKNNLASDIGSKSTINS